MNTITRIAAVAVLTSPADSPLESTVITNGNGICEPGETAQNAPRDCAPLDDVTSLDIQQPNG